MAFFAKCFIISSFIALTLGTSCELGPDTSLQCFLRTLQSELDIADQQDVTRAKNLKIKCSDVFFFESQVKSEHFGSLPRLERLDIEFCKIRQLPARAFAGLSNLKALSLRSHNAEWSSIVLDVDSRAFNMLHNMEVLDLSLNNLWSLPGSSLCDLPSLRKLNISNNHILDLVDLGLSFEDGCHVGLTEIDLSSNQLSTVKGNDLRLAGSTLEKLDLSLNRITILADDAIVGLAALRELNLADNMLAALPPTLFNASSTLEKLHLQNNSLTMLTPAIFAQLSRLVSLNLSRNSIATHLIGEETFAGLTNLQALDLSHNQLSSVEASIFGKLTSLRMLNLEHNKIHSIASGAFSSLKGLQILSLSFNNIERVEVSSFDGLSALNSLSLDHNGLQFLHPDQFLSSSSSLEDLSLNDNQLAEVPKTIAQLPKLRTLDLGENNILELRALDFENLYQLYGLRIAGNKISSIKRSVFANTTNMHVLNLAHNKLSEVEQGAFESMKNLRALRLDNNMLSDINGVVSSLSKLQWFNVSSNRLLWFDYAFVPMSLEWLDIHNNEIEELGNYYNLKSGFNLKTLDASSNLIKTLTKLSLPVSLEQVSLSNNAIRKIDNAVFEDKPHLSKVELVGNEISHLKLSTLSVGQFESRGRPEFFLSGNPFVCDCELQWMRNYADITLGDHQPRISDIDDVMCRLNNAANDTVIHVTSLKPEQFLCQYQTHCFSMCMCCEFYACDCRMQCPEGCSCFHDSTWTTNVIECSAKGHSDVPLLIPMDATEVRLDGNNLGDVNTQSFIGRKRVRSLYMNNSLVTSISKETFSGLAHLEVLHLENNKLKEIEGHEFSALTGLKELYLNNNDLIRIAESTFESLTSLVLLRLDGNLLTSFPVWTLANNAYLVAVYLAENLWSCDCKFTQPFIQYLDLHRDRIADRSSIKCVTDNLVNDLPDNVICDDVTAPLIETANKIEDRGDLVPILVSVVLAIVILIVGFLVVCVYKTKIKNWLYTKSHEIYESRSGSSITSEGTLQNKLFDVYISYSSKDMDFVDHTLAPTLEHGSTSYRLCLHQRDFPPSASLYDTVSVATESSSRVLVVLSRTYLETEWPHVRIPLRNSLHQRDNKLIILLLDKFEQNEFENYPELRQYLKTSPSVQWGSPGFINKLRFFLPEPVLLTFQRNVTLRTLQPTLYKYSSPSNVLSSSGVWTSYGETQNSPAGTISTHSTTDGTNLNITSVPANRTFIHRHQHSAPSVISSLYSHHTYQSIPEAHIYHTLEPCDAINKMPVNAVYINKNLDIVLKPVANCEHIQEVEEEVKQKIDEKSVMSTFSSSSEQKVAPPSSSSGSSSSSNSSCIHAHTQSTLSAQQLLPPSGENDEYIV